MHRGTAVHQKHTTELQQFLHFFCKRRNLFTLGSDSYRFKSKATSRTLNWTHCAHTMIKVRKINSFHIYFYHYDVAVIQWLSSFHNNRMTTCYITPGSWHVTSLRRPWHRSNHMIRAMTWRHLSVTSPSENQFRKKFIYYGYYRLLDFERWIFF